MGIHHFLITSGRAITSAAVSTGPAVAWALISFPVCGLVCAAVTKLIWEMLRLLGRPVAVDNVYGRIQCQDLETGWRERRACALLFILFFSITALQVVVAIMVPDCVFVFAFTVGVTLWTLGMYIVGEFKLNIDGCLTEIGTGLFPGPFGACITYIFSILLTLRYQKYLQAFTEFVSRDYTQWFVFVEISALLIPYALLVASFVRLMLTSSGIPPHVLTLLQQQRSTFNCVMNMSRCSVGSIRYCNLCRVWKPPRCQHCSICGVCVFGMSQHLPHLGTCIGGHNSKFCFLTCFYLLVLCFEALAIICLHGFVKQDFGILMVQRFCPIPPMAQLIVASTLAITMSFWAIWYLRFALVNLTRNFTQIEAVEAKEGAISKYDHGLVQNLAAALGPNPMLWLLPTRFAVSLHYKQPPCEVPDTIGQMHAIREVATSTTDIGFDSIVIWRFWSKGQQVFFSVSMAILIGSGLLSFYFLHANGLASGPVDFMLSLLQIRGVTEALDMLGTVVVPAAVTWIALCEALFEGAPQGLLQFYSQLLERHGISMVVLASVLWSFAGISSALCRLDRVGAYSGSRPWLATYAEVGFRIASVAAFGAIMRPSGLSMHDNQQIWLWVVLVGDYVAMLIYCKLVARVPAFSIIWAALLVLASPPKFMGMFTRRLRIAYHVWRFLELSSMVVACFTCLQSRRAVHVSWKGILFMQVDTSRMPCFITDRIFIAVIVTTGVAHTIYVVRYFRSDEDTVQCTMHDSFMAVQRATKRGDILMMTMQIQLALAADDVIKSAYQTLARESFDFDDGAIQIALRDCFPLSVAACRGDVRATRLLLSYGFDPDEVSEFCGAELTIKTNALSPTASWCVSSSSMTPLILASWAGHLDLVQFLIDHGVDIHKTALLEPPSNLSEDAHGGEAYSAAAAPQPAPDTPDESKLTTMQLECSALIDQRIKVSEGLLPGDMHALREQIRNLEEEISVLEVALFRLPVRSSKQEHATARQAATIRLAEEHRIMSHFEAELAEIRNRFDKCGIEGQPQLELLKAHLDALESRDNRIANLEKIVRLLRRADVSRVSRQALP